MKPANRPVIKVQAFGSCNKVCAISVHGLLARVLAHGLCIMFVVIRWWWKARWRPVKVTVNSNRGTVSSLCVHVCVCVCVCVLQCSAVWMDACRLFQHWSKNETILFQHLNQNNCSCQKPYLWTGFQKLNLFYFILFIYFIFYIYCFYFFLYIL